MSDYFSRISRLARRSIRAMGISKLSDAMHGHKSEGKGSLTTQNAGYSAVAFAREILNNYDMPSRPKLSYSGIRGARCASHSSKLEDGVVTVFAEFRTRSGVLVGVDMPIEIRKGEFVEPSVVVHNGAPRVIAQSTFDHITNLNTSYQTDPERSMYSAPPVGPIQHNQPRERINTGMFSVQSNRQKLADVIAGRAIKADPGDSDRYNIIDPRNLWNGGPGEDPKGAPAQAPVHDPSVNTHEIVDPKGLWSPKRPPSAPAAGEPSGDRYNIVDPHGIWNSPYEEDTLDTPPQAKTRSLRGPSRDQTNQIDMAEALAPTDPSKPWGRESQYRPDGKEHLDHDRNLVDGDDLDVAERDVSDLPGSEVSLKESLEVKDRGGVTHEYAKGKKVLVVRDMAGDGKEFVVRFDDGLEALVERCFLAREASLTKLASDKIVEIAYDAKNTGEVLYLVMTQDGMWYVKSPSFSMPPQNDAEFAKTDGLLFLQDMYNLESVPVLQWQPYSQKLAGSEGKNHMAAGPDEEALNLKINDLSHKMDMGLISKDVGMKQLNILVQQRQNLRKIMSPEFVDKVASEMHSLLQSGVSEIECKEVLAKKYGSDIASIVFNK